MDIIKLLDNKIDINSCVSSIMSDECGGLSTFIGATRNEFNGKKVIKLEYEAYHEMAENELKKVCNRTRSFWPEIKNIIIVHRIGSVPIGEIGILIASNSFHRIHALKATKYMINEIKKTVPIWKKEFYEENVLWKHNLECDWI